MKNNNINDNDKQKAIPTKKNSDKKIETKRNSDKNKSDKKQ